MQWIENIPSYKGCGVYALVDDNGKCYIGQTRNVYRRVKELSTLNAEYMNNKMKGAILSGLNFRCVILAKLSNVLTKDELKCIVRFFIEKYGGMDNTYNVAMPISCNHKHPEDSYIAQYHARYLRG